jgi:hypothetical protein
VAPSIVWGLGVGLVIALADAVTNFLAARNLLSDWPIDEMDLTISVVLYTLIGFRVGKATGLVRDAAEGGVLAAFLASFIGIGFLLLLKPALNGVESTMDVVRLVSQDVALGGLIAIVSGWIGSRVGVDGTNSRF